MVAQLIVNRSDLPMWLPPDYRASMVHAIANHRNTSCGGVISSVVGLYTHALAAMRDIPTRDSSCGYELSVNLIHRTTRGSLIVSHCVLYHCGRR